MASSAAMMALRGGDHDRSGPVARRQHRPKSLQAGDRAEEVQPYCRRIGSTDAGNGGQTVDRPICGRSDSCDELLTALGRGQIGGDVGIVQVTADHSCPVWASRVAVAAPIPEAAPVTT